MKSCFRQIQSKPPVHSSIMFHSLCGCDEVPVLRFCITWQDTSCAAIHTLKPWPCSPFGVALKTVPLSHLWSLGALVALDLWIQLGVGDKDTCPFLYQHFLPTLKSPCANLGWNVTRGQEGAVLLAVGQCGWSPAGSEGRISAVCFEFCYHLFCLFVSSKC